MEVGGGGAAATALVEEEEGGEEEAAAVAPPPTHARSPQPQRWWRRVEVIVYIYLWYKMFDFCGFLWIFNPTLWKNPRFSPPAEIIDKKAPPFAFFVPERGGFLIKGGFLKSNTPDR